MSKLIRVSKGLDIKLKGAAKKVINESPMIEFFTVKPSDFHSIKTKLVKKTGDLVKAGEAIFYNKECEEMKFVSPVSGEVVEVVYGERRKVLEVKIKADEDQSYLDFGRVNPVGLPEKEVISRLLESGCWTFIKQRPYDIIADPSKKPKSIFISMHGTAPLAPSYEFVLEDKMRAVQAALNALSILTDGEIHIAINHRKKHSIFKDLHYVNIHKVSGPHPSGNVSTLISKIDPINKGEVVWTIQPQDLVIIGELFLSGKYQAEKTIAITGAMVKEPCYYTTKIGASLETLLKGKLTGANARVISGNVLTGNNEGIKGSLRHYHDAITVIPEGDDYEIFGWLKPVANKVSITRSFTFSWLFPKRKFNLNTNTNGEERAFVITGHYEKVFPLDIYPMQLLKSCLYEDLDEMESIGMYEVAPEDFALTEFVCISKQPHQEIVRKGLDLMLKEIG